MKTITLSVVGFLLSLVLIHGGMYLANQALHPKEAIIVPVRADLKAERLKLNDQARSELSTYGWVDERRDYAKIPLDRAFDYYLRSP